MMKMEEETLVEDDSTTTTTTTTTQENTADSRLSGADAEDDYEPPPAKKRRGANKRVVRIPIGGGDGSGDGSRRSKAEVYPPPDSWSWRKYGQKPIKGSPYPRGYYRCSSSKGCPARKQVERSHLDPTMLIITYTCEHNHPLTPAAASKFHRHQSIILPTKTPNEDCATFANQPELDKADTFTELASELGWLVDVGCTVLDNTIFTNPSWAQVELEVFMPIGEEDKLLFGDLGDLPESSLIFGHCTT